MARKITTRENADWLDNTPIREAVEQAEAKGLSKSMICERCGFTRIRKGRKSMETSQLDRRIGRRSDKGKDGQSFYSRTIHYDVAVNICRAIDRDPWELGL